MSITDEALLDLYVTSRNQEYRDELVRRNLALAHTVAKRFSGRGVEYDDLYQVACEAMYKAIERYTLDRGTRLSTYLIPNMVGRVKNYFRDHAALIRTPRSYAQILKKLTDAENKLMQITGEKPQLSEIAQEAQIELEDAIMAMELQKNSSYVELDKTFDEDEELTVGEAVPFIEKGYEEFENADFIKNAIQILDDREKEILRLRYKEELTQRAAAEIMGLSQMSVSRLEKRLLEKLRAYAENRNI